jgi:hypothetical protein
MNLPGISLGLARFFCQPRQQFPSNLTDRPQGHALPSLIEISNAIEIALEQRAMSQANSRRTLGKRIADSLRLRINNGSLRRKELPVMLDCSESTIDNLLSNLTEPSSPIIDKLMEKMDASFCNEIWAPAGIVVFKLSDARAEAIREANAALDKVRVLGVLS